MIICTLHIRKMMPLKKVILQTDDKMTKKQVMEEKIHAQCNWHKQCGAKNILICYDALYGKALNLFTDKIMKKVVI